MGVLEIIEGVLGGSEDAHFIKTCNLAIDMMVLLRLMSFKKNSN